MSVKRLLPFLLLLVPLALALVMPRFIGRGADGPIPLVPCPDPVQGCRLPLGDGAAEVRFMSNPAPLRAFDLVVKAPGASQASADFSMLGMDMGPNHYVLQRSTDGTWHGKIVLPVCVSGTSNWIMMLELDGKMVRIPFKATK